MPKHFQEFLTVAAFFISILSVYIAYSANGISNEANSISKESLVSAQEANKIAGESKLLTKNKSIFEEKQKSSELIDQAYDDIYENEGKYNTLNGLINNRNVDKNKLINLIDIYENLGKKYCNGLIITEDLRSSMFNSLLTICKNSQVNKLLKGHKNGTAILCYKFVPKSLFAKTLKQNSLKYCNFLN